MNGQKKIGLALVGVALIGAAAAYIVKRNGWESRVRKAILLLVPPKKK